MFNPRLWGFRRPRDRRRHDPRPHLLERRPFIFLDELYFNPRMADRFHMHHHDAHDFGPNFSADPRRFPGARRMDGFPRRDQPMPFEWQNAPRPSPRIPGCEMRGGPEQLPFRRAMRKLYRQLVKTIQKYEDFQTAYDTDIATIKPYADEKVLEILWVLKLKGKRDCGDPPDEEGVDETVDIQYDQFVATANHLTECLRAARNSVVEGGPRVPRKQERRVEAANRVLEKVHIASYQIVDLLHSASKGREYCKELLAELESLKTLIDPDKNKDLYKEFEGNRELSDSEDERESFYQD